MAIFFSFAHHDTHSPGNQQGTTIALGICWKERYHHQWLSLDNCASKCLREVSWQDPRWPWPMGCSKIFWNSLLSRLSPLKIQWFVKQIAPENRQTPKRKGSYSKIFQPSIFSWEHVFREGSIPKLGSDSRLSTTAGNRLECWGTCWFSSNTHPLKMYLPDVNKRYVCVFQPLPYKMGVGNGIL